MKIMKIRPSEIDKDYCVAIPAGKKSARAQNNPKNGYPDIKFVKEKELNFFFAPFGREFYQIESILSLIFYFFFHFIPPPAKIFGILRFKIDFSFLFVDF